MGDDTGSLEVIPVDECYRLLEGHEFGRIGVVSPHGPLIMPVNYGMDGTTLVIRTHPGSTLAAAQHARVSFQVDDIDRRTRSGWSVLLLGVAEEVGADDRVEVIRRTHAVDVRPWAPGEHGTWLRLWPQTVTGRRLLATDLPWGVDQRAYL